MSEELTSEAPKKKGPMLIVIAVVVVAVVEAVGFFVAIKMMGGGAAATYGDDAHALDEANPNEVKTMEIELLSRFRVPNAKSGQLYLYEFDIVIVVPAPEEEDEELEPGESEMEKLIDAHRGALSDSAAQIIRSATPSVLAEDDLRTLRLQLQRAFVEELQDPEAVVRVLIPRCVPLRAG